MELLIANHKADSRMATRGATLAQVAQLAGVSKAAASLVLNRSETGTRVSNATRERILEAAVSLRYTPNAVARSLSKRKTDVIAFYNAENVVFDLNFPFYAALLAGVQDGCSEHRKDLHIHANFRGRSEDDIFLGLHNGRVDGLLLYARVITPLVERLIKSHLPVVTIVHEIPGVPYVGVDDVSGSQMLARYLAEKGYKRVLYRSIDSQHISNAQTIRKQAFCNEAMALGLGISHVSYDPTMSTMPTSEEAALLLSERRPDVMVCGSDAAADGIAAFCLQNGLHIPQDMALVGFDGLKPSRRPALQLTTIRASWQNVARTAVGLLAAQCSGEDVPERTILPVEFLEGNTT